MFYRFFKSQIVRFTFTTLLVLFFWLQEARAAAPSAPTGVSASDGTYTDKVKISWTAPAGATSYYIYKATSSGGTKTTLSTSTTSTYFYDTSATAGVVYYYWVKAHNTDGTSDFSSSNTGIRKLTAPTSVSASDSSYTDKVRISWTASSGTVSYYSVFRATSSSGSKSTLTTTTTTSSPYDDTTAVAGTTYYYWVEAISTSTGGSSDYSSSNTGIRKLTAPTSVSASDSSYTDKVRISWTASSGTVSYYSVFRATSSSGSKSTLTTTTTTASPFDDTTATAGTTYYYWVKAVNSTTSSASSGYSSSDTGVRAVAAPSAPTGVSASDNTYTDKVKISWTAPSGTVTSYAVYRGSSSSTITTLLSSSISSSTTYYDDTSAVAGTTYYYCVTASNSGGTSSCSSSDTGIRSATPVISKFVIRAWRGPSILSLDSDRAGASDTSCSSDSDTYTYISEDYGDGGTYSGAVDFVAPGKLIVEWSVSGATDISIPGLGLTGLDSDGWKNLNADSSGSLEIEATNSSGTTTATVSYTVIDYPPGDPTTDSDCVEIDLRSQWLSVTSGGWAKYGNGGESYSCTYDDFDYTDSWECADCYTGTYDTSLSEWSAGSSSGYVHFDEDSLSMTGQHDYWEFQHVVPDDADIWLTYDVRVIGDYGTLQADAVIDFRDHPSDYCSSGIMDGTSSPPVYSTSSGTWYSVSWDFGRANDSTRADFLHFSHTGSTGLARVIPMLRAVTDGTGGGTIDFRNVNMWCCGSGCDACRDYDGDGHGDGCGSGNYGWDCNDEDATVYPGASEDSTSADLDCNIKSGETFECGTYP